MDRKLFPTNNPQDSIVSGMSHLVLSNAEPDSPFDRGYDAETIVSTVSLANIARIQSRRVGSSTRLAGLLLTYHCGTQQILGNWDPLEQGSAIADVYNSGDDGALHTLTFRFSPHMPKDADSSSNGTRGSALMRFVNGVTTKRFFGIQSIQCRQFKCGDPSKVWPRSPFLLEEYSWY